MSKKATAVINPSSASREREGPIAQRWEGEGRSVKTLTRLRAAPGATLSRDAGEGFMEPIR